jgi:hypothetical protein
MVQSDNECLSDRVVPLPRAFAGGARDIAWTLAAGAGRQFPLLARSLACLQYTSARDDAYESTSYN